MIREAFSSDLDQGTFMHIVDSIDVFKMKVYSIDVFRGNVDSIDFW